MDRETLNASIDTFLAGDAHINRKHNISGNRKYFLHHADEVYICTICGAPETPHYSEPTKTHMLADKTCFHCNYDKETAEQLEKDYAKLTIIDGRCYRPGNRTSGSFRGMAGRRFDIEYLAPSIHAGKRVTTYDLWCGAEVPEAVRERFPDTARFLNGAEEARVPTGDQEITCFNGSRTNTTPYPLPSVAFNQGVKK